MNEQRIAELEAERGRQVAFNEHYRKGVYAGDPRCSPKIYWEQHVARLSEIDQELKQLTS